MDMHNSGDHTHFQHEIFWMRLGCLIVWNCFLPLLHHTATAIPPTCPLPSADCDTTTITQLDLQKKISVIEMAARVARHPCHWVRWVPGSKPFHRHKHKNFLPGWVRECHMGTNATCWGSSFSLGWTEKVCDFFFRPVNPRLSHTQQCLHFIET